MTIPWDRRAEEALKEAKRWREAAARHPHRTHRRKMAFWWAKRFERDAEQYRAHTLSDCEA